MPRTGRGKALAFAPFCDAATETATKHPFQTACSTVLQVDAVAEGVTKPIALAGDLSVPQVDAAPSKTHTFRTV